MTLCSSHLHPITVYRTGFGVGAVLVLNHNGFLLLIHDDCDYYWELYGHYFILNYAYLGFQ